jgi:phenylacetic acid degradation operon negative regulatory protein
MDPPELPVAQLVRLTGLFGISENRARVALSRMVAAGEATTDGSGRYRLAGHLRGSPGAPVGQPIRVTTDYSGRWWLAVVTTSGSTADVRSARRRALAYARLAELREGVWMRPDNVARPLTTNTGLDGDVEFMSARPSDARRLAARLWDLEEWSMRSFALLDRLAALPPAGPDVLAPGFALSAAVLRHLQADPLLPEELQPPRWPGRQLRAHYDEWDTRYRSTLAE